MSSSLRPNPHDFSGADDGAHPIGPLAFGADGALYGTTYDGALGRDVVYRITGAGFTP